MSLALVYALTAATKSRKTQRSKVAKDILEIIAEMQPSLVEQALLINNELIRCAILWHELWHEVLHDYLLKYYDFYLGIGRRIKILFSREKHRRNAECAKTYAIGIPKKLMINGSLALHQKIEHGHATLKEQSFNQIYYKELKDAYEHCEVFKRTGNQKEMTAAWVLAKSHTTLKQNSTLRIFITMFSRKYPISCAK